MKESDELVSGGRFPRARPQPLPSLTLSPGSSARAVPAGVAALHSFISTVLWNIICIEII
ncbi:hypothetical protein CXF77_00580 [Planococcus sp. MB-3u-09]|nr:hypothetical protein CW734_07050 [Planococcus sp. MB-3u-03]PKG46199.1 hypothetical protein CXF66_08840 [Planococcus sp. Urea-trap-24]PKG89982.1 hypothetical protein CXF91_05270 [Planococcus sp. Urea-3u-39]PKH44002.1 hypothetical protein CXF77_00580 [Planococcus sp. MB-3u-09]